MSITTVLIIIIGLLILYYVGMIAYDLYMDKLKSESESSEKEETIDISDQLDDFESIEISRTSDSDTFANKVMKQCLGFDADTIGQMMDDAGNGKHNAGLNNLLYLCHEMDAA